MISIDAIARKTFLIIFALIGAAWPYFLHMGGVFLVTTSPQEALRASIGGAVLTRTTRPELRGMSQFAFLPVAPVPAWSKLPRLARQ